MREKGAMITLPISRSLTVIMKALNIHQQFVERLSRTRDSQGIIGREGGQDDLIRLEVYAGLGFSLAFRYPDGYRGKTYLSFRELL